MPLTEIEEVFGGRWQDMEYGDGYTLTIYREGHLLPVGRYGAAAAGEGL